MCCVVVHCGPRSITNRIRPPSRPRPPTTKPPTRRCAELSQPRGKWRRQKDHFFQKEWTPCSTGQHFSTVRCGGKHLRLRALKKLRPFRYVGMSAWRQTECSACNDRYAGRLDIRDISMDKVCPSNQLTSQAPLRLTCHPSTPLGAPCQTVAGLTTKSMTRGRP